MVDDRGRRPRNRALGPERRHPAIRVGRVGGGLVGFPPRLAVLAPKESALSSGLEASPTPTATALSCSAPRARPTRTACAVYRPGCAHNRSAPERSPAFGSVTTSGGGQ